MTTETNKLKHLNFILIKELRESKTEITILKQEREVNKTIIKQLSQVTVRGIAKSRLVNFRFSWATEAS